MARNRARANPDSCKQPAGTVHPLIDYHRCEGKADCLAVCPYDVIEVRRITKDEAKAMPLLPWIKVMIHGGKQAFAINPEACHACGACVAACPEKAIRLLKV